MQTSVTFKNLEASDSLKSYVSGKLDRFDKLLDNPAKADVVLLVEKHRHIVEVNINADRLSINGKEETGDMYSAIDMVLDKLEKQLMDGLITLANGVRVIMKPTDFKTDEVLFSATSPGGNSLVNDADYPEAAVAAKVDLRAELERLAVEAQDLTATLPALPIVQWFDGTFEKTAADAPFVKYDLARLLQFLADFGVCEKG